MDINHAYDSLTYTRGDTMKKHHVFRFWLLLMSVTAVACNIIDNEIKEETSIVISVQNYGAEADGLTDDSQAFMEAWRVVCNQAATGNPTLLIPGGKTYLLYPVNFEGPCNSPVTIQVFGNIVAPSKGIFESKGVNTWIEFNHVEQLTVTGDGQFDGKGSSWWDCKKDIKENRHACELNPTALGFHHCYGLQLNGFRSIDSPRNHLSIDECNYATISHLHLSAPETSPNTDGIDIAHSTQVHVLDTTIETGDDCIAINDGCSFINIDNVFCGPGHGISVGGLGMNGARETVTDVHVKHCTFRNTLNGARIKTSPGGSGFAKNIIFEDIVFEAAQNPIIIDQFYCYNESCEDKKPVVAISDVEFIDLHGTAASDPAINIKCSRFEPCTNIKVDHINIVSSTNPKQPVTSVCQNAYGEYTDSAPPLPCMSPQYLSFQGNPGTKLASTLLDSITLFLLTFLSILV